MSVSFSQTNPFQATNVSDFPVFVPAQPKAIAFAGKPDSVNLAKTVRFGSEFAGHISDWAKKVPDPPMTQASLMAGVDKKQQAIEAEYQRIKTASGQDAADKYRKQASTYSQLEMVTQFLKLNYFQWRYSDALVPAQVKSRVNRYKWLSVEGWRDWLTDNAKYQRMLVTLRGPIYIKEKQAWVQAQLGGPKQMYEATLKQFDDPRKFFEDSGVNEMPANKRLMVKTLFYVMRPIAGFFMRRQLKTIDALQPLQNKVPELPKSFFKAELALVQKEYNAAHTADPIIAVEDKALASGSIGQVYKAKTKSGAFKVLKVARPDATQAFFEAYQPYAYYNELFRTGTGVNQKARACVEVENNTRFLTGESNLGREKTNADMMKAELSRLGINGSLEILAPDFASSTGRSLVSDFLPGTDLTDLNLAQGDALKEHTVPKVLDALLFAKTCKPLDIHNGNFRKKQNADVLAWLDFGRQANLNANVYQHLNNLSVAVMIATGYDRSRSFDRESGLSSPLVSQALVDLFAATPDSPWAKSAQALHASNQAIDALETQLYGPINPATGDRQTRDGYRLAGSGADLVRQLQDLRDARQKGELSTQITQMKGLVNSLFAPATQLLSAENRKNLRDTDGATPASSVGSGNSYYSSSLLSVWANYELMSKKLQNGVADLPALCTNAVSKNDLSNYYQKTRQFMRPYFTLNPEHQEAFKAKVANLSLAEFVAATVDEYGYMPWQVRDLSKGITEQAGRLLSRDRGAEAPDEGAFKKEWAALLAKKTDKNLGELLKLIYRSQHETRLADTLAERYISETQASLGVTLAPYQITQLTRGIKRGLSEDMSSYS